MERELGRLLIAAGAVLLLIGVLFTFGSGLRLGRLPGDISISRGSFRLYIPLGTCLFISIVVTLFLRILSSR